MRLFDRCKISVLVTVAALSFYLGMAFVFSALPSDAQEIGSVAPLNPAFVEYLKHLRTERLTATNAEGYRSLGHAPSPLDYSCLRGLQVFGEAAAGTFPASYDLRVLGRVTSVKDQGVCGTCWNFAAYGSLESRLLMLIGETWDFSEQNLKNTDGFDWDPCNGGGNGLMSTAYLARWSGPVNESDDPYNTSVNVSPPNLPVREHVQGVLFIPPRAGPTDNNNLKQAIMTYGAVQTSIYWDPAYYNADTFSYNYTGTNVTNHDVALVGWNDTYDKNNFSQPPPDNGAFIAKNSWGTSWGQNGYFYISYYDTQLASESFMYTSVEPTSNYTRIYQYDWLGPTSHLGATDSLGKGLDTAWFANIFTAQAGEPLQAVSFYVASPNSPYEVSVYTDVSSDPSTGTLAGTKTGTITSPGYSTIGLDSAVMLTAGKKFSVVVKLTTPNYNYPVPMETPIPGYSSKATANPGESYWSWNGTSWTDMTTQYANTNVCLKAFTGNPPLSVSLANGWNLVSLPLLQPTTAVDTVLASIRGAYAVVWAYPGQVWKFYDPSGPEGSTLTTMDAGSGYWIKSSSPQALSLIGNPAPSSLNLLKGWNLVGYNNTVSGTSSSVLTGIAGKYSIVWGYPNGAWKFYDPSDPDGNTLQTFDPGNGYWIKANEAVTWTLP